MDVAPLAVALFAPFALLTLLRLELLAAGAGRLGEDDLFLIRVEADHAEVFQLVAFVVELLKVARAVSELAGRG